MLYGQWYVYLLYRLLIISVRTYNETAFCNLLPTGSLAIGFNARALPPIRRHPFDTHLSLSLFIFYGKPLQLSDKKKNKQNKSTRVFFSSLYLVL